MEGGDAEMIKKLTFIEQQELLGIFQNIIKVLTPVRVVFPETEVAKLFDQARAFMTKLQYGQPASETTHTPGPWEVGKNTEEIKNCVVANIQGTVTEIAFSTFPEGGDSDVRIKTAEANARLIALAPAMLNALLKVRRWRQVEHDLDGATVDGRPELADLMKECPKLESEFEAVIDQIEEMQR